MKSLEELKKLREQAKNMVALREKSDRTRITVCMGTCGIAAGARDTLAAIMDELAKRNLNDVEVVQTGCIGYCDKEPLVEVQKPGKEKVIYARVDQERARQIIAKHIVNDQVVGEWALKTE